VYYQSSPRFASKEPFPGTVSPVFVCACPALQHMH